MDREQAIKELQESHDIMRNHDIDESESYLMQALNMAIKALEQEPKWISVIERLPKGEMACLVYGKMHFIPDHVNEKDWFYDYSIGCFNPAFGWSTRGDMEVLAWMPLPKPYEPQESEE